MGIDYTPNVNLQDLKNKQILAIINTITVFKQNAAAGPINGTDPVVFATNPVTSALVSIDATNTSFTFNRAGTYKLELNAQIDVPIGNTGTQIDTVLRKDGAPIVQSRTQEYIPDNKALVNSAKLVYILTVQAEANGYDFIIQGPTDGFIQGNSAILTITYLKN
jgi:hypothetical protein